MKPPKRKRVSERFETHQQVLIRAVIGPSGVTGDDGIFVRVNADDPEVWVHLSDVIAITPEIKKVLPKRA